MIGNLTTKNKVSVLLEKVQVKACTWAIFPNEEPFPSTLQETAAKTQMPESFSKGAHYNTGDGIKMAMKVGADLWHMGFNANPFTFICNNKL